jgi:hypothetical protein
MQIYAAKGWQDTGYRPGAQSSTYIVIRAEGQWCVRTDDRPYGTRNADGGRDDTGAVYWVNCEGDQAYPYSGPGARMGQLIGKFGANGAPFIVGKFQKWSVADCPSGTLWLCANHPDTTNNDGSLEVTFTTSNVYGSPEKSQHWDRIAQRWVDC